jgi:hypothetical protein
LDVVGGLPCIQGKMDPPWGVQTLPFDKGGSPVLVPLGRFAHFLFVPSE